jgi:multisubunit Na+/H+ antiporter MnhG subunit
MGIHICRPIGLLLSIVGGLLAAFGVFSDPAIYARSLGFNVNLWWGLVMLLVGVGFLLVDRRRR